MHARAVLDLTTARPATLGAGRLVCIDGPAGSGKTTLAARLAALAPEAVVLHTDDMLAGWSGLPGLAATLAALLGPLARGEPGRWRRWDWHDGGWAETCTVAPPKLLVLEGVGCWSPAIAGLVTTLVWVEAPAPVRRARGLARDGDAFAPHWEQWAREEAELFARHGTRDHADLVVAT